MLTTRFSRVVVMTCVALVMSVAACVQAQSDGNAIRAEQTERDIRFTNDLVTVSLRHSERGFALQRIYGVVRDQDYLTDTPTDLFEIRMTLDPKHVGRDDRGTRQTGHTTVMEEMAGDHFTIGSHAARRISWEVDQRDGEASLHLHWRGMDLREQEGVLDVEVIITLREGDPLSYWRINVTNHSTKYGIERVRFPLISLRPIGETQHNVYIYPKFRGGVAFDPFNAPEGLGQGFHEDAGFYPLTFNMQFQALYNQQTDTGIYLATHDPAPAMKLFQIINSSEEILWKPSHFPPNITFADEDFPLPYDCVIGPFQGDWYDACQIYRDWAVEQTWASKGPLVSREDVPRWYTRSPLFLFSHTGDSAAGTNSAPRNHIIGVEHTREILDWLDMPVPITWWAWEKYHDGMTNLHTPFNSRRMAGSGRWADLYNHNCFDGNYPAISALDTFASANAELRERGGMVVPYICLQLFDQGPLENAPYAQQARPHMSHGLYGSLFQYRGYRSWLPCASTQWWRDRMVETSVTLVERENAGGLFLDVMHGMCHPCYWTAHGHSAAGGDSMTSGMHGLVKAIRDAVHAKHPEVILVGENPGENMIDVIDGIQNQRPLSDKTRAPLFATVYQDYILRFGRFITVANPDHVTVQCASLFTEGAQVGAIRLKPRGGHLDLDDPKQQEVVAMLEKMVGYYKHEVSQRFLSYGQLMRPLSFDAPAPLPTVMYNSYQYSMPEPVPFPALFSGVFRLQDGSLGIFIVNVSPDAIAYESRLDLSNYGMNADAVVDVDAVSHDGASRDVAADVSGAVTLSDTLAGRGVTMYLIRQEQ